MWKKIAIAAVFVVLVVLGYQYLSFEQIAQREAALREYQSEHPVLVYGLAFLFYVAVAGFSLPFAAPLTLAYGWFFDFWPALLLVSFASTIGATLAFLLSRFVLRESIQSKFAEQLKGFNQALEREGAFYLFSLRLIPAVPFFVINLVMGLTPLKTATYYLVSQVGMLPGTAVYVYAGTTFPSLDVIAKEGAGGILTPQIIFAFVLLAGFPFLVKFLFRKFRKEPLPTGPEAAEGGPSTAAGDSAHEDQPAS